VTVDEDAVAVAEAEKELGPLAVAGLLDEAQIYDGMWRGGQVLPRDVDELYIWEIAVLCGLDEEIDRTEKQKDAAPARRGRRNDDPHEYLRARLAYSKGHGPKPVARSIDPDAFAALNEALS
jgi:hypothetical protein